MWSIIRKKQNKKGEEGFTLIELIVVIAILGFLLAIAIPRYTTARIKAAQNATQANLHNLANAIEIYATEKGEIGYPASVVIAQGWMDDYILKSPKTPNSKNYQMVANANTFAIYDPDNYNDGANNHYMVGPGGIIENLAGTAGTGTALSW